MAYTTIPADNETIANLPGDIRTVTALITSHTEATTAAHEAGAISYGTETVETALDTAAGHMANQNNPHNVTAAQVGAASGDHNHDTRYDARYAAASSTPSVNATGFRLTYSATAPSSPQNGKELWIDTTNKVIKIYEDNSWVTLGAAYQ